MRLAASALVFALGLFALVAQTLLFRTWLGAFEGTELSIGAFFGSWLLWVALGAWLARRVAHRVRRLGVLAGLALLYLPAFALQSWLTFAARELTGVPVYEVVPLGGLLGVAVLVNLPVSLLTGALFTFACRVAAEDATLPVARVWILECLGAFAGGLGVTLWLAAGLGGPFADARDRATWRRVFPAGEPAGAFATAQARYVHGVHANVRQVLAWGAATDVLPDDVGAGEIVAVHRSQTVTARRVLVVGPGALAAALAFESLPDVEEVVWLHPDPEYPQALRQAWPGAFEGAPGLRTPGDDARDHVRRSRGRYGLVVLHLPDVTTLVANRYATREFLELVEGALDFGGVAGLRIRGGENVLGPERARLGASALYTLERVFPRVVLKPGEETWLLASRQAPLATEPAVLRDRFASVPGAAALYPPEAVPALYLPDRAAFQMRRYREVIEAAGASADVELLNTDGHPKALLYGLLLALRAEGHAGLEASLAAVLRAGAWILAAGLLLFAAFRVLAPWLARRRGAPAPRSVSTFDAGWLVFTAGLTGMALAIVWMFVYQARHGTLYLHVGLLASWFMVGLVLGGAAATRLLARAAEEPAWMLPACLGVGGLAVLAPLALPDGAGGIAIFGGITLAGVGAGLLFPLAAFRMRLAGRSAERAGATLETADHLGGALGAFATGLILLPLFGVRVTLVLLLGVVATNAAGRIAARWAPAPRSAQTDRRLRTAGWVLAGVTSWVLVASWGLRVARADDRGALVERAARELAGDTAFAREQATLPSGEALTYFASEDGWIFDTGPLAPDAVGYGGRIELAVRVDPEGALVGWTWIRSRETPAYARLLDGWRETLLGRNLFAADPFHGVDAVSGATITSDAVLSSLDAAGRAFARDVLGRPVEGAARAAAATPWVDGLVLLLLTAIAVALRRVVHPWVRRGWLAAVLVLGGLWLNAQYSSAQVFALLQGELPALMLSAAFYLVVLVPLVVLLFGNLYCGWLCPFGAAQELLGDLGRRRLESDPHPDAWRWGRRVKYVLLALILVAAAVTGAREVLAADPLVTFFAWTAGGLTLGLAVAGLGLSLVYGRFFCRNLCPAGAFLAILNRVRLLRRWLPPPRPGRCDLGVRNHHELDCIGCDRCRHVPVPEADHA